MGRCEEQMGLYSTLWRCLALHCEASDINWVGYLNYANRFPLAE
jgi:hypothetical protein